jgi:hypothetical protein
MKYWGTRFHILLSSIWTSLPASTFDWHRTGVAAAQHDSGKCHTVQLKSRITIYPMSL